MLRIAPYHSAALGATHPSRGATAAVSQAARRVYHNFHETMTHLRAAGSPTPRPSRPSVGHRLIHLSHAHREQ